MASASLPSTVLGQVRHEIEIKRSRFIATAAHAADLGAAEATIAAVRKEFWDARHHCTALILGINADQQRSSDDGEPSGTAGVPMLEVLRQQGLTDVVVVVTRYFGGVLLGAGGLVRAYTASVAETIAHAQLVRRAWRLPVTVPCAVADAGRLENQLRAWAGVHEATITGVDYTASHAVIAAAVAPEHGSDFAAAVAAFGGGRNEPVWGDAQIVDLAPAPHGQPST